MAEIVAAFGVPHTPNFPALVKRLGPECEVAKLYREVARNLEAIQPDVIVIFDCDHLNTFFFDNLPTFAIGVTERIEGPNDQTPMPHYAVAVSTALAAHVHATGLGDGFDLSLAQELDVDHSIMVPLHFLTPNMQIPIVPIFVNGLAPPLPLSQRCHALGQMVRAAIQHWPGKLRVAVIASGSFSLEVGGPKIEPGHRAGVPDPEWARNVRQRLERAEITDLLNEATTSRMLRAGNVSGELLNWIAMLGVIGDRKPRFLQPQVEQGHAFGVWRWD